MKPIVKDIYGLEIKVGDYIRYIIPQARGTADLDVFGKVMKTTVVRTQVRHSHEVIHLSVTYRAVEVRDHAERINCSEYRCRKKLSNMRYPEEKMVKLYKRNGEVPPNVLAILDHPTNVLAGRTFNVKNS